MNAEAANDVDPKYYLNPRFIVSIQVRVGDVWIGIVWACIPIFVWLQGKIRVGEWCGKLRGVTSCEVNLLLPSTLSLSVCLHKN